MMEIGHSRASLLLTARVLCAMLALIAVTAAGSGAAILWSTASGDTGAGLWPLARAVSLAAVLIVFLRWFAVACENAHTLDPEVCEFFPHGAIAAFLLPGVNLVLPFTIAQRIWLATGRAAARGVTSIDGVARILPVVLRRQAVADWCSDETVSVWWCWSLVMVFSHAMALMAGSGAFAATASLGAEAATVGAAIAAVRMVGRITELQLVCIESSPAAA